MINGSSLSLALTHNLSHCRVSSAPSVELSVVISSNRLLSIIFAKSAIDL